MYLIILRKIASPSIVACTKVWFKFSLDFDPLFETVSIVVSIVVNHLRLGELTSEVQCLTFALLLGAIFLTQVQGSSGRLFYVLFS